MKNFKSNLKNYILFFVSNILAIAELFAFWGLNDVVKKAVKDGVTAATLKSDFVLAAGLITFIPVPIKIPNTRENTHPTVYSTNRSRYDVFFFIPRTINVV